MLDTIGALMAGQGILTALLHRERSGQGQRVDVSLPNGTLLAHAARLSIFLATGEEPGRWGSGHPYIERQALAVDPRFASRADRLASRGELTALLAAVFLERTVAAWMNRLEAHDVLCASVNRYADLPHDPQVVATGLIVEQEHPRAGRFRTLDTPVRLDRTPGGIRTPAPALGEHTEVVLADAGLTSEDIARLREAGAIG